MLRALACVALAGCVPTRSTGLRAQITDQAIYQSNMPFAAAMAVFLVLMSLGLVGLTLLVGRKEDAL